MPSDDNNIISVRFSNDFEVELYKLSKRYSNIRLDIQPIIEELQVGQEERR